MNVSNLLVALCVETYEFLTSRCSHRFLKVRIDAPPSRSRLVGDTIALVKPLGAIARLVFRIELCEGVGEAIGDTMLIVKGDSTLNRGVANHVTVGEVLGNNT